MTLPESTLEQLASVDKDRAKAIVKVANEALAPGSSPEAPVALIRVAPGTEVILVTHSDHLKRIPWLRLVEIAPARFLLSMPSGTAVEALEVALTDLLQEVGPEEARERALLESLRAHLSQLRRDQSMTKAEILIVDSVS